MNANVTQLLNEWNQGQDSAKELSPIIYDAMRKLSARYIKQEKQGYTLQATELVHDAYIKLVDSEIDWKNRKHFYAIAATTMRRLLVDRARKKNADKHGGGFQKVTFIESQLERGGESQQIDNIGLLDEVIDQLNQLDERKAMIVQLYYFAGLTYHEIALCLELSEATVDRELRFSKAWLATQVQSMNDEHHTVSINT